MIKKVLIILILIVLLILVGGLIAPGEFRIQRAIDINKPNAVVFNYLRFLKNAEKWSPLLKKDPRIVKEFRGEDGKVGSTLAWSGDDQVGTGEQEIKNIVEGKRIDFQLSMKKPFSEIFPAYFITEPLSDSVTRVKWGFTSKIPYPMNILCFFMGANKKIGREFEQGLSNLKSILEE